MTTDKDPTHCDRCNAFLRGGWCERWQGDKRAEVFCADCDKTEKLAEYTKTNLLTTSLLCDAAIYGARREMKSGTPRDFTMERIQLESAQIRESCKAFERGVWFAGFQSAVQRADNRGFKASFSVGDVQCKALAWSCAGRTAFTFEPEDESYQVSLITAEDETEPVMGVNSVLATGAQAVGIISAATKALLCGNGFVRDDKVGMFPFGAAAAE